MVSFTYFLVIIYINTNDIIFFLLFQQVTDRGYPRPDGGLGQIWSLSNRSGVWGKISNITLSLGKYNITLNDHFIVQDEN